MGDSVENNLPRGRLGSLNGVLLRIAVQEDVQFRDLGNPTAIDFPVELNRELHSHSLPPLAKSGASRPTGTSRPGVISVGDSRDEVERLIQEAIELHLEGMREEGISIPPPASIAGVVEIDPAAGW